MKSSTFLVVVVLLMVPSWGQINDLTNFNPCPSGTTPVQNNDWPGSNGCGPEWRPFIRKMVQGVAMNGVLTPCCDDHDFCISRCGHPDFKGSFDSCNEIFKRCLYDTCDTLAATIKKRVRRAIFKAGCKSTAFAFANGVKIGRGEYMKSQKAYCDCV